MFPFSSQRREDRLRQECCEWFLASRHALLAYARQHVDCEGDVELLLTDVVRRVTQAVCGGRICPADMAPYALRSISNAAIDLRRRNARRQAAEQRFYAEEHIYAAAPPSGLNDEHLRARQALQQLPDVLATVIELRVWENQSFPAIARQLHLSESTVRRHYEKGLQRLKDILNQV